MSTFLEILKVTAPSVITGLGAVLKSHQSINSKLKEVLTEVGTLETKLNGFGKRLLGLRQILKEDIRKEIAQQLPRAVTDFFLRSTDIAELTEEVRSLKQAFEALRRDFESHEDKFSEFSSSQSESWERVQRALGHIEGFLASRRST